MLRECKKPSSIKNSLNLTCKLRFVPKISGGLRPIMNQRTANSKLNDAQLVLKGLFHRSDRLLEIGKPAFRVEGVMGVLRFGLFAWP